MTSLLRLESEDQEESARPPVILAKCGRTTRVEGHSDYEQIFGSRKGPYPLPLAYISKCLVDPTGKEQ